MKKCLLLLAINIAVSPAIFGQGQPNADQKMLPSANGGTNESMGNLFSPSIFDGAANISIPIYSFKNDYGNFGISANYNTKGVTVDEMSGPIGTHWNLNCGGTITRTMRDIPDEVDATVSGYPTNHHLVGRQAQYLLASKGANDYWDGQNDDYNVAAGNLNFTFKLGKNGYIYSYPQSRAKIEKTSLSNNQSGFKITDIDGSIYEFNVSDFTIQHFATGLKTSPNADLEYISKWKLVKVTFPNGQEIKYNYSEFWYPTNLKLYKYWGKKETSDGNTTSAVGTNQYVTAGSLGGLYSFFLDSINYPNNVTAIFDIDQVITPNVEVSLRTIKQIRIKEENNCSRYVFNKVYLNAGTATATETPFDNSSDYNRETASRLILKSIVMANCKDNTVEPYYSFEYVSTSPQSRMSGARDFFGYMNSSATDNTITYFNLVPNHYHPFLPISSASYILGQDRNVSANVDLIACMNLKKIKNAYGGSVTFNYEPHSGLVNQIGIPSSTLNDPLFLGYNANDGVRIKSIVTEDKYYPNNSRIVNYTYSGGQYFLNGGYYSYPSNISNGIINEYTINNTWVSPHQLINGSNHGYSSVTVETKDNASNLLSKTTYSFTNFKDGGILKYKLNGNATSKNYYEAPYTDKQYIRDWEIGLPKQITQYDQNGNIVSRTTNHYKSIMVDNNQILNGLQLNTNQITNAIPANANSNILTLPVIASDIYLPYSGISLLDTSVNETFVNDNLSLKDSTFYEYDTRNNLKVTTNKNSKGIYFQNKSIYNYTVLETGTITPLAPANALQLMYNKSIEKIVSTEKWKLGSAGSSPNVNSQLYDATIYVFANQANKIWTQKMYSLRSINPISYGAYTGIGTAGTITNPYGKILEAYNGSAPSGFLPTTELLSKDAINNPTETRVGGVDLYKSMIWDIKTGNKLAEANCRLNEMAYSGFENATTGNWTYNAGNVVDVNTTSIGLIDGKKILKIYNYETAPVSINALTPNKEYILTFWCNGNVPSITGGGLTNIPLNMVSAAIDPTNSGWKFYQARFTPTTGAAVTLLAGLTASTIFCYLDDIRIFPTGSQMTSWTYTPLWGPSSVTDPNGRITYFDYDAFGRLVVTKNQEGKIISKKEYVVGQ